jgi:phosphohistidine phosphatase SixA
MRQATLKAVAGSSPNRRRALSLAGITGVALLAAVTAARAQSTGIAVCDDFLTKYDACVVTKIPDAQRATYKTQLDQTRKAWLDMSKNPSTKATMEATCKQTMDAMKTSLTALGCSF